MGGPGGRRRRGRQRMRWLDGITDSMDSSLSIPGIYEFTEAEGRPVVTLSGRWGSCGPRQSGSSVGVSPGL